MISVKEILCWLKGFEPTAIWLASSFQGIGFLIEICISCINHLILFGTDIWGTLQRRIKADLKCEGIYWFGLFALSLLLQFEFAGWPLMLLQVESSSIFLSLQEKCGWPFPVGHRLATTCSASTQTCTSRWTKRKPSGCAPSATSPRSTTTSCSTASSTTFSCRRGKFVHPGTVLMALVVDYPTVLKVLSSNPMESLLSSFSFENRRKQWRRFKAIVQVCLG